MFFVFLVKHNNLEFGITGGRADSVSDNTVSVVLWWICSCDVCFQYRSLFKQQKACLILLEGTDNTTVGHETENQNL